MKSSCGNHHRPAGICNIVSILVTVPRLIGVPSDKPHIHTNHAETELTWSMSTFPRHIAVASCQLKASTTPSTLSHQQIQHPARRHQLPPHPRQLCLTLQSPHLLRQRFLPSRRLRLHRRLCGLRKCHGSISPLVSSPPSDWRVYSIRNGNRRLRLQRHSRSIRIRIGTLRRRRRKM